MRDAMRERGLPVEGLKADLVEVLQQSNWQKAIKEAVESKDYDLLHCEVKSLANARRFKVSGSRKDLVQRLREEDHKASLPVKREVERIARSRRDAAGITAENCKETLRNLSDSVDFSFKQHELMVLQGPNGPSVFDELGYKLDHEKIAHHPTRPRVPCWNKVEAKMLRSKGRKRQKEL